MKSIMLSIQPKWVEKIASGEKTVEVRMTAPAFTPFKCYIYCTKGKNGRYGKYFFYEDKDGVIVDNGVHYSAFESGKVIGEFVCDNVENVLVLSKDFDGIVEQTKSVYRLLEQSCLTLAELHNYADRDAYNARVVRGWHISDLVIYDKPKDLREFRRVGVCEDFFTNCMCMEHCQYSQIDYDGNFVCVAKPITRPPQSWCYVEDLGEVK